MIPHKPQAHFMLTTTAGDEIIFATVGVMVDHSTVMEVTNRAIGTENAATTVTAQSTWPEIVINHPAIIIVVAMVVVVAEITIMVVVDKVVEMGTTIITTKATGMAVMATTMAITMAIMATGIAIPGVAARVMAIGSIRVPIPELLHACKCRSTGSTWK